MAPYTESPEIIDAVVVGETQWQNVIYFICVPVCEDIVAESTYVILGVEDGIDDSLLWALAATCEENPRHLMKQHWSALAHVGGFSHACEK